MHRLHQTWWGRVCTGLTLAMLILVVKMFTIERMPWYDGFRLWTFGVIQRGFAMGSGAGDQPVILVDISKIATVNDAAVAPGGPAVSRSELLERLGQVAGGGAEAIGVDVDFSPDETGNPITFRDNDFFDECLRIEQEHNVRIYLGVDRHAADDEEKWLGSARYAPLAAGLSIGNEEYQKEAAEMHTEVPSVLRMFRWIRVGGKPTKVRSLAYALSRREEEAEEHPASWIDWALEVKSEFRPSPDFEAEGFVVDYRLLDRLLSTTIPVDLLDKTSPATFRDKIVILGDVHTAPESAEEERDLFRVPGRKGLYSGAILHGCAVDSLLGRPIRQWTHAGRFALDLVVTIGLLLLVELLQAVFRRRKVETGHRVSWWVSITASIVAIVIALPFAHTLGLIWDDVLFVVLGLIIETAIEHRLALSIHHSQHAAETT